MYRNPYEAAYDEMRGQSIDTPQLTKKADGYIHITPGTNAAKNGNAWNYNGTAISGNADIVSGAKKSAPINTNNANKNQTVKKRGTLLTPNGVSVVEWNKNAKDVSKGTRNLKSILAGDAYEVNPEKVSYNNANGNLAINGNDTGISAADFADGVNSSNSRALSNAYTKGTGEEVDWARGYADTLGIGNAITWSDGKVMLGGKEIPYQYIDDSGHAYVKKSVLDKAAADYKAQRGIRTETEAAANILKKHSSAVSDALDRVVNRDKWSYSPEDDPAYQAYAKMYARNAEQAYNRAMGSGGLYGRPTSYQQYQAIAGYADNMQQLTDKIPELAQADYSRYSDEQQRRLAAYNALAAERQSEYNMIYNANRDTLNRIGDSEKQLYDRDRAAQFENPVLTDNIDQSHIKTALNTNELKQSNEYTEAYPDILNTEMNIALADLTGKQLSNMTSAINNALSVAKARGYFTSEDAEIIGLSKNSNGEYPSPYSAEANAAIYLWNNAQRQIAAEKAIYGLK